MRGDRDRLHICGVTAPGRVMRVRLFRLQTQHGHSNPLRPSVCRKEFRGLAVAGPDSDRSAQVEERRDDHIDPNADTLGTFGPARLRISFD